MKKSIANIITGSRILCSLPLLFVPLSSVWFFILYLFCGITDMIDGRIARKTGVASDFGARLDTAADVVFMCVCGGKILPRVHIPAWLWGWILSIALAKIVLIAVVFIREKKLLSVHSVCNKITGFALFLLPLSLTFMEAVYSIATISALATIAVVEEVLFVVRGQTAAPSGKGRFLCCQESC